MATSYSSSSISALLINNKITHNHKNANDDGRFSFRRQNNLQRLSIASPSYKVSRDLIVRRAAPEVAGELQSALSFPGIPLFPMDETTWLAVGPGLLLGGLIVIPRLVALIEQVDAAAQLVEIIADTVRKGAEQLDKAAEKLEDALPEGLVKQVVDFVEHVAEETAQVAVQISLLMDQVEERADNLKAFIGKLFKGREDKA